MTTDMAQAFLRKLVARKLREARQAHPVPAAWEHDDRKVPTPVAVVVETAVGVTMAVYTEIGPNRWEMRRQARDLACSRLGITETQLHQLWSHDDWDEAARAVEEWQ